MSLLVIRRKVGGEETYKMTVRLHDGKQLQCKVKLDFKETRRGKMYKVLILIGWLYYIIALL